jgi:Trm5-related predicted tRNA methylase
MKYSDELHYLTDELDGCYRNTFSYENQGNNSIGFARLMIVNERIKQIRKNQSSSELGGIDNKDSEEEKFKKLKALESRINERSVILENFSSQDPAMPTFPLDLWFIIAGYEVELAPLIGQISDSEQSSSNSWCEIM